jgi:hypothetical protein
MYITPALYASLPCKVALGGLESALSAERAQNKSLQHTVACNMQDFKTLKQLHEDEIQAVQERASQSVHRYQADLEDAWGVFARLQSEHEREALVWKVKHDEHKIETAAGAERILAQVCLNSSADALTTLKIIVFCAVQLKNCSVICPSTHSSSSMLHTHRANNTFSGPTRLKRPAKKCSRKLQSCPPKGAS